MPPYKIPELAGKPYRPRNGSEGSLFMERFCYRCQREAKYRKTRDGADSCPIVRNALFYGDNDPQYPKEWTHTAEGEPTCTAFEAEAEAP